MKETRRGGIQTIQQIIRRLSEENQERRNPNNSTSHQKTLRAKPGEEISRQFNKSSEDCQRKTRRGGNPDNSTSYQMTVRGKPGEEVSRQFNKSSEDCQRKTRRGGIQTIQQVIRRLSEENQERRDPNNSTSHQKTVRGKPLYRNTCSLELEITT